MTTKTLNPGSWWGRCSEYTLKDAPTYIKFSNKLVTN